MAKGCDVEVDITTRTANQDKTQKSMKKQKIVVGTEYYFPETSAASGFYLTGIAETLTDKYDVDVICVSQNLRNNKRIKHEKINGVNITRLSGGSIDKDKLVFRAFKFSYLAIQYFFRFMFKVKKNDKLCVVTNPAPIIFIGSIIKRLKGIEYTIIVHDVFPENLLSTDLISQESFLYRILLRLFNWSYKQSDKLIVLGSDMQMILAKKLQDYSGEIVVVPNWSETKDISTNGKEHNEIVRELGLEDKTIFGFAGNIGRAQGIPNLLAGIEQLDATDIHFLVFGSGALLGLLLDTEKKKANLTYAGSFPRNEKNKFLTACDVAIVTLLKGVAGLGVPSKTYDIMASGRPILVIADEYSEIVKLIQEHDIGWYCPPDDPDQLTKIALNISSTPEEIRAKGKKARRLAEQYYDRTLILDKYLDNI